MKAIIDKVRQWHYINHKLHRPVSDLIEEICAVRKQSEDIAICPQPIETCWMGIHNATHRLFPNSSFTFPQYYSRKVYSVKELNEFADGIAALKFRNIIFSGFPSYFGILVNRLNENTFNPHSVISTVYHGSFSGFGDSAEAKAVVSMIISLARQKKIQKLAFVKKGMAETFEQLWKIKSYWLPVPFSNDNKPAIKNTRTKETIDIGIFGSETFNKNLHTQVAAALMIKNGIANVFNPGLFDYFEAGNRIIGYNNPLPHQDFIQLLTSMDINLYLSFSEAWPQIVIESLANGVPCLMSDNNGILDNSGELKEMLVVQRYDNPCKISEKIDQALNNKEEISKRCISFMTDLNQMAVEKRTVFLRS